MELWDDGADLKSGKAHAAVKDLGGGENAKTE
jgi:hypothetical protein